MYQKARVLYFDLTSTAASYCIDGTFGSFINSHFKDCSYKVGASQSGRLLLRVEGTPAAIESALNDAIVVSAIQQRVFPRYNVIVRLKSAPSGVNWKEYTYSELLSSYYDLESTF